MLMNCWRNATHWACLTGIIVCFCPFFLLKRCDKTQNANCFAVLVNSIASLAVAQNMRELYRLVLVDTPLAPYFSECITSEVKTAADRFCSNKYKCIFVLYFLSHNS
jgi:hypothetical protein